MSLRPCIFRPMLRIAVIRNQAGQNLLIVLYFFVHVGRRGLSFFDALIRLLALPQDDLIPGVQGFSGLRQTAQVAVFLDILNGRTAALQAGDALHPIDGFFVKNTTVAFISLAGQKIDISVVANCMFCRMEHLGKLFQCM